MTSDKQLYLLNTRGPTFPARFVTLFEDPQAKSIATVAFQYPSHLGFGSGLLCPESSTPTEAYMLRQAEELAWNRSFVSSPLPDFYRSQNAAGSSVKFLLLDDQYPYVVDQVKAGYQAEIDDKNELEKRYTFKLPSGQTWHF